MITWLCKPFNELATKELYQLMALRQEVFVVEQNCAYLDADGKDYKSHHVMGYLGVKLVACSRIVAPGVSYKEVSVGRVTTSLDYRGKGYGIELMEKSHGFIRELYGEVPIRISAQCYLESYYKLLGYSPTGNEYLEDGIPHMEMLRAAYF
ncbi:MAG: GNAT family N-acetyltransferase [Bacteroidetes bacterium]|nr:GNAT family N-acetyltransferase [Bacteroidota bacterium]